MTDNRWSVDIRVDYLPDHETPTFDEDNRPFLTYGQHPEHGWGWILSYLENDSDTAGVEDYFIPGDLADVDSSSRAGTVRDSSRVQGVTNDAP